MDLEDYKKIVELDECIYRLKLKNIKFEKRKEVFDLMSLNHKELDKLSFVDDFAELIGENLKKMSALTLALMNQSEETNSTSCVFKLRKELKSVLIEYLQRLISFTLNDNGDVSKSEQEMQHDQKVSSDDIEPVYDFIIKKLETEIIKDENDKKMLNEIAEDFRKIYDQLEKFTKKFN